MYKEHPSFNTPPDDAMIWRYMSLDRFASLFDERMLYFCSMEKLKKGDPHEGSYYACKLLNDVEPEEAQGFAQKASSCGDPIVVNCWHLSDHESMAMWKLYSKDNKGIAIQSRIKRLKTEFVNFKDSVFIGEIIYTDDPIDDPSGWPIVIFTS
ncbi:MAG: hypothetical protein JXA11_10100, partial [Phycisphaerae bacterium]|nr:hypothetical protein [Phycisphaerae bacterium]